MSRFPIVMKRTATGLAPVSSFDAEELDRIGIGSEVEVSIHQRRSGKNHRHFFVVLSRIVESGATPFPTVETFLDALKMSMGHVEMRQSMSGPPYFVPASISWAKMSEHEFKEFKQRAFELIAVHYKIDPTQIERETK